MKLKVGDVVEFKKYENMTYGEIAGIDEESFPKSGKIIEIINNGFFIIEDWKYLFNPESVARVISDNDDNNIDNFNSGDEVLVKATVKEVFNGFLQIESSVDKKDVIKILNHKTPERFIVKEDYYGMYIGASWKLVSDKRKAKIYTSRNTANDDAIDMRLNKWNMIPYDG